jgi:hypothetical protein
MFSHGVSTPSMFVQLRIHSSINLTNYVGRSTQFNIETLSLKLLSYYLPICFSFASLHIVLLSKLLIFEYFSVAHTYNVIKQFCGLFEF